MSDQNPAPNPMDALNALLGNPVPGASDPTTQPGVTQQPAKQQFRYVVCPRKECGRIELHDMAKGLPDSKCPYCNETVARRVMPSKQLAEDLSASLTQQPKEETVFDSAAEIPAPANDQPPVAQTPVAPAPKKPRNRNTSRAAALPKVMSTAEANAVIDDIHNNLSTQDQVKVARQQAVAALITKYGLNAVEIKEIGTGVVMTLGFTQWIDDEDGNRIPAYTLMEMTDTPESFRKLFDEARKHDGRVSIDAAQMTGLSAEVLACSYQGFVIANLRNNTGAIRVKIDQKVRLGAKLSTAGRPVYYVLGAAK